jgi:biopolymer transport protein ExbD
MAEINVVPYIDVMLVLLIIFMITAPLLKEGVKVDLPAAGAKPIDADLLKNHEPLILSIDARVHQLRPEPGPADFGSGGEFAHGRAPAP